MRTIRNHKAKVDFIYRFLLNSSSDSQDPKHYLIIIGKGGTGKTTTLNEALDKSNELDNIHIWNEGEKPYLINFNSANDLHIFIRQEDDNFVKCLQNEFDCVTIKFEADDLTIEQNRDTEALSAAEGAAACSVIASAAGAACRRGRFSLSYLTSCISGSTSY